MKLKALIAGIAGAMMTLSAAQAADLPIYYPAPPAMAPAPAGFSWTGRYVGAGLIVPVFPAVQAGFDVARNNFLFGAQAFVAVGPGQNGIAVLLGGEARAGILLGASDRFLAYGSAAAMWAPMFPGIQLAVGIGGELAIGTRASIFGEFLRGINAPGGAIRLGVNFHRN